MVTVRKMLVAVVAVLACSGAGAIVPACELCGIPPETLREQIAKSDLAVIVQRMSATPPTQSTPVGSMTLKVRHVLNDTGLSDATPRLQTGQIFEFKQYVEGVDQGLYLLIATVSRESQELIWGSPLDITSSAVTYLQQLPSQEATALERMRYYLAYLEHDDDIVSNDAWGEVAGAKYEDMQAAKELLPLEKLRAWLKSAETLETRCGLYALLLGIGGQAEDIPLVESRVFVDSEEQPIGLMASMGGYLLLTRGRGLDRIHQEIILNPSAADEDLFAALSVYRFLWEYEPDRIPREKIKLSMHHLLLNPNLFSLVILDLSRWKDWGVIDEVARLFVHPDFSDRASRQDVIRYLTAAANDLSEADATADDLPPHVTKAREHLARLRKDHKDLIRSAERFTPD